jgi:glycosyltransferase involved in cell wall biosynthesis
VSVIVCAHNELENLKKLIPALLSQQYPNFELILADDRSSDGSADYLRQQYSHDVRLRIIRIEENNLRENFKKHALTKAIEAANHDILLLTDADCLPASPLWIDGMTRALGKKEIVLGYSPYMFRKGLLNLLIRYETFLTAVQYLSFALAGMPYMGVGRNLLYRKSLFVKNNGFHNHIHTTGGDDDLFIREVATAENTAVCFEKNTQMLSLPKEDYFSWWKQKRRHLSVGFQYKLKHKILLGLSIMAHILFYTSLGVVFYQDYKAAFLFLMIRGLVFLVIFTLIARKLGVNYHVWIWLFIPIDVIYIFNYLVISFSLWIDKKIKWN